MRRCRGVLLAALLMTSAGAAPGAETSQAPTVAAPSVTRAAMAEYQRKLAEYTQARAKFDEAAGPYWSAVAEKRRVRNAKRRDGREIAAEDYVLTQPPLYAGPPAPIDPSAPDKPVRDRKYIPVVADFLKSAQEHFGFVPQRPKSESEFKRAYAKAALAAGLTRDQIVRIYGFETGGNGTYDAQAGQEYSPHARAISPALGYNQLLNTNSVELLAERGEAFVTALKARSEKLAGEPKQGLEAKVEVLRRMIKFCRSVPDDWTEHDILANSPKGLGVHAIVLDIDVGPLLQTQKLVDSIVFARRKSHHAALTAAELEMMNLTGDGNGLDMVMMPAALRERVPTANFFLQAGYERNPVAIRNNVVAKLFAATNASMDRAAASQGARDLAAALAGP